MKKRDEKPRGKPEEKDLRSRGFKSYGVKSPGVKTFEPRAPESFLVWGRHAVQGALAQAPSSSELHVIVDRQGESPKQLAPILDQAKRQGIFVRTHHSTDSWPLQEETEANHQRVCLTLAHYPTHSLEVAVKIIQEHKAEERWGCSGIVLDSIQDPRNFGSILRSAAFFGAKFVIYAKDRQAPLTPVVVKTSAGGAFAVKLICVTNISRALEELKKAGAWSLGTSLELGNPQPLDKFHADRPWVAVLGNEAKGLRPEVAKHCDACAIIPGTENDCVESLNVGVAAGLVLYALTGKSAPKK